MSIVTLGPLNEIDGMRHAFFTRQGGVSTGLYSSLNCGLGSGDDALAVRENRARAMEALELSPESLTTLYQIHGREVVVLDAPLEDGNRPKADALVTAKPGVALGILTADCVPVLFCDAAARVIGAAHAGWKGAIGGVLEATLDAMVRLGAEPGHVCAGIGPCIAQRSYEVGPEFPSPFLAGNPDNARFFAPARTPGKWMFDLRGYVADRLSLAGVGDVSALPNDTCGEADRFFSYRRSCLRHEQDYGRGLSAIVLEG